MSAQIKVKNIKPGMVIDSHGHPVFVRKVDITSKFVELETTNFHGELKSKVFYNNSHLVEVMGTPAN